MKTLLLWLGLAACCAAGTPLFEQTDFEAEAGGWALWTPRDETAPKLSVNAGVLVVSGGSNIAACGGWERLVPGVEAGRWYRFVAHYQAKGVEFERGQVVPRLDWVSADGKRAGKPDYAYQTERVGGWTRFTLDAPAPDNAVAVKLQLLLWNSPTGTVRWDDVLLTPIPAPPARSVTIASINLRPRNTGSAEASVARFMQTVESTVKRKVDIILLPEGITVVGTGKNYADVAEPVPGPTTRRLGEMAKRHNAYVAAGVYEKEEPALYNTAVLLDRDGRLVGKYRKVYVPREETEGGIAAGSDYPVFETDFGKVGMMICWDVQYADPARALALRGAELLLMPIWGGNEVLAKARAIENQVFIAASGYGYPTHIIDPNGEILAVASDKGSAAIATIDLNRRYVDNWLGHMRGRFMKEVRLDVPVASIR